MPTTGPAAPTVAPTRGRPRLVALRALGMGDLLTAVPALRALARAFPHHHRTLAAPAWLAPLAALTGAVHDVVDTAPLAALPPALHRPDVAVNLHGCGPQSHRVLLAARPRRLVAFAHPDVPRPGAAPRWRGLEHQVRRWCRLLEESGIPADPTDLLLDPAGLPPCPPGLVGATVVHPMSASPTRRWPSGRFAAVAAAEQAAGRRVVVTGGLGEEAVAASVAEQAGLGPDAVLAGRLALPDLAALVAAAGRVVTGDTGVGHLATALATPSVVLFGPVGPDEWGPPPSARHVALWSGRRGDPDGAVPDPGLLAVTVDDVLAALERLGGPAVTGVAAGGHGSRPAAAGTQGS